MNATLPRPPAIPGPTPETHGKLVQASGSLTPTPFRTAPIVQKPAPQRHEITDPRIQAKGAVYFPLGQCADGDEPDPFEQVRQT